MQSLPPVGFWSYTRQDDQESHGRMAALRRILARELQSRMGTGEQVLMFQDIGTVNAGGDWQDKITDALAEASFLVVVITPAYLRSQWCVEELLHFHAREQALGRSDLIFPIHYINVDDIDPPDHEACHDRRVWDILKTRQWLDLRDIRQLDMERSPAAWSHVGGLARAIQSALQQGTISSYFNDTLRSKYFRNLLAHSREF